MAAGSIKKVLVGQSQTLLFFLVIAAIYYLSKSSPYGKSEEVSPITVGCTSRTTEPSWQTPNNPHHCFVNTTAVTKLTIAPEQAGNGDKEAVIGGIFFANYTDWYVVYQFNLMVQLKIEYFDSATAETPSETNYYEKVDLPIWFEKKEFSEWGEIGRLKLLKGSRVEITVLDMSLSKEPWASKYFSDGLIRGRYVGSLFVYVPQHRKIELILAGRAFGFLLGVAAILYYMVKAAASKQLLTLRFTFSLLGLIASTACLEPISLYLEYWPDYEYYLYLSNHAFHALMALGLINFTLMTAIKASDFGIAYNLRAFLMIVLYIILAIYQVLKHTFDQRIYNEHNTNVREKHRSGFVTGIRAASETLSLTVCISSFVFATISLFRHVFKKSYTYQYWVIVFCCCFIHKETRKSFRTVLHTHLPTHLLNSFVPLSIYMVICSATASRPPAGQSKKGYERVPQAN
jgi:hypothetical protein